VGWTCSAYVEIIKAHKIRQKNLRGREYLKDVGVDGNIILK
jgi:hypothetical protein